ncbi:hypothetical protein DA2_0574 [Desulfovibrio sp. A2]|nr:hypothetical protein DA2_0574 [Desulfovibrio sp. A2]
MACPGVCQAEAVAARRTPIDRSGSRTQTAPRKRTATRPCRHPARGRQASLVRGGKPPCFRLAFKRRGRRARSVHQP